MERYSRFLVGVASAAALMAGQLMTAPVSAAEGASVAEQGKKIAFSRKKGNCLACHMMDDGVSPGNVAPPLLAMKTRYPDKSKLRAQIWDPMAANVETAMPRFGKHKILSEDEIDKIVEYLLTL